MIGVTSFGEEMKLNERFEIDFNGLLQLSLEKGKGELCFLKPLLQFTEWNPRRIHGSSFDTTNGPIMTDQRVPGGQAHPNSSVMRKISTFGHTSRWNFIPSIVSGSFNFLFILRKKKIIEESMKYVIIWNLKLYL